jgi:hypothetical protein
LPIFSPSLAEIPPEPKAAPPKPARSSRPVSVTEPVTQSPLGSPQTSRGASEELRITLSDDEEDDEPSTTPMQTQPSVDDDDESAPGTPTPHGVSTPTTRMDNEHPEVYFGFLERKPVREVRLGTMVLCHRGGLIGHRC